MDDDSKDSGSKGESDVEAELENEDFGSESEEVASDEIEF